MANAQESTPNLPAVLSDQLDRPSIYIDPFISNKPLTYGGISNGDISNDPYSQAIKHATASIETRRQEQLENARSQGRVLGAMVLATQAFSGYQDSISAENYADRFTAANGLNPERGRHQYVPGVHRAILPERAKFEFAKLATAGKHEAHTGRHRAPNKLAVAARAGLTAVRSVIKRAKTPKYSPRGAELFDTGQHRVVPS